jgi:hypothetical protein
MYDESGVRTVTVRQVVEENISKDLYLVHLGRADETIWRRKGARLGSGYWNQERERKERIPRWIKDRL